MGPAATTASGMLVGLILFLSCAMVGVIAVNGPENPGVTRSQESAAAGATAESPAPAPKRGSSFQSLDLDGDGRLSLAEAAGYGEIVTRFDRADRNRDGRLTAAEFERLSKLPPPKAGKAKSAKKISRRPETTAPSGG